MYDSCKDRHCPTCSGSRRHDWLERMLSPERLPATPFMHVVFTLPHELCALVRLNPGPLYRLFFQVASQSLLVLGKKQLDARLGLTMVLHSWGSHLNHHPHIHCVATAGGPSLDGMRWIAAADCHSFVSYESLAARLRRRYLAGIERLYRGVKLVLPRSLAAIDSPVALERWLAPVAAKDWRVHVQAPPRHCEDAAAVLKYLARYVSGAAIHDGRIESVDDDSVTFMAKNYRQGTRGPVTLSGEEFVRRFLIHVLPPRLRRLRECGLFAPHKRAENMELCRRLLACSNAALKQPQEVDEPESDTAANEEVQQDPPERPCPRCGVTMIWLGKLTADAIRRLRDQRTPLVWGDLTAQLPRPES